MTCRVLRAVTLALAGLLTTHASLAKPIACFSSTIPTWIRVTGFTSDGTPDPEGLYCVTARDFAFNPVGGVKVTLDFSACCDISLCKAVFPGQSLESCTPAVISAMTDASGMACFHVAGAATDNGVYVQPNAPRGAMGPCVGIYFDMESNHTACGTIINALVYDQNGAVAPASGPGVNALDLSVLSSLIRANNLTGGGEYRARANYSGPTVGDAVIDALDLSLLAAQIHRTHLTPENSSIAGCPGGNYCAAPSCP